MISCVIRTFNEGQLINQLLNSLFAQNYKYPPEIVVVDSGSTDGTIETIKKFNVQLIQIKKEDFNYSYALNLGIEKCGNELIALLSGHAVPFDETWFEKIITHFNDNRVAAVYCRQIPMPDANPYEVLRINKMFGDTEKSAEHFSNAACCIRKSVWQEHPYQILPAAEDKEWAQWAMNNGYKIIYEPRAEVYHSHNEPSRRAAARIIDIEKANDLRVRRNRTDMLTMKQSIGLFVSDLKKLPLIQSDIYTKLALIRDSAVKSFWYAYDFNRRK
ncbi:MAG: glycosyltransferase family A protein [Phycisphaerales bacterium]